VSLEPATESERLYLALGGDVNPARPIFTGDVFEQVEIPGVGTASAIVIGHPCSIRGRNGSLQDRIPVAAVEDHPVHPPKTWATGFFDRMPLPGLPLLGDYHAARLGALGLAATGSLRTATRIACLSEPGINQLQQRLVYHQTRLEVPVTTFQEAFDHTYEEAELLENWATDFEGTIEEATAEFERWIRAGSPSRQQRLLDYAERAPIRRELRNELRRRTQRDDKI